MCTTLNVPYVYFHYAAYKVRVSCNTRENVADLIHVAKHHTSVLYGQRLRITYVCMYCVIYIAMTYSPLYTYAVLYMRERHDIRMYYKFGTSTRDCKIYCHALCTRYFLRTARINFNKLEFSPTCLKMKF